MPDSLKLSQLIGALSHALDMTEGQPPGHCVRCCWIGTHIGREIGLDQASLRALYYTLLLKDLGCSSNAARICELYLADDRRFKHDFKLVDGSLPQVLNFVLSHTGLKTGLAERFRERFRDRTPNETMAGTYSAVNHYLKAVKSTGTDDGEAVVKAMHETPVNDFEMKDVTIRADGQVMRPMYAATIKSPDESKSDYDYYTITGVVPAEDAWRPASESNCALLK